MTERVVCSEEISRSLLVSETGEANVEYQPCHLIGQAEGEECIINLVPIALHQGKLLVAAPAEVWSRTVAERLLPKNSFKKPVLVEVMTATQCAHASVGGPAAWRGHSASS